MAASTSCSALIGSAPWICARRRRERLAETLAPVGPQAPPAPSARCALDSASERRGALLWTTGTSGVRANLSIMSPNTCPPCLRPLHTAGEGAERSEAGEGSADWSAIDNKPRLASLRIGGTELTIGDRVRLNPKGRADIMDLVLKDRVAVIEAIESDFEDRVHLAVTIADDPGREMGFGHMPGHRFFFGPEEVQPLPKESPE